MSKVIIALRVVLIFDVVMQPFAVWWMIIIAGRIRRDQLQIQQFLKIWGDRLLRTSTEVFMQGIQIKAPHATPSNEKS